MKILFVTIQIIIVTSLSSFAQSNRADQYDERLIPIDHNVDVTHMTLHVSFEPKKGKVIGYVNIDFTVLQSKIDSLFLDAPGIKIKNIKMGLSELNYKKSDDGMTIYFANSLTRDIDYSITIFYESFPRKGLYFVGWDNQNNLSRKQIWTQGQGIDNRYWIPYYNNINDKLTTELFIEFDNAFQVLSNGDFISKKKVNINTDRWHYKAREPHSFYLIMLRIGKYSIKEDASKNGVLR